MNEFNSKNPHPDCGLVEHHFTRNGESFVASAKEPFDNWTLIRKANSATYAFTFESLALAVQAMTDAA